MNKYIGKKLDGRYEIQELIGIGGMADVYKATDVLEDKVVAVKILKDEFLTNEDFKRRFRNESKAIAVLSHPNIVKVFDVSFGERVQFIVMECVEGITLKEYIEQQKVVSWKEAVHFTVQILRALQHAHDNGIVHRDVKPQNVMLLQDGTVKVMDFGIARFARDNGKTISDKAIGSVHYISPEQAKGEVTDEKTDIYSIGVMLFEMLTGRLPFDGDTPIAVAVKQMQAEPEKPRSINENIPEGLEEIVIRAMKKDLDLRYQTAAEMLRDIDEFKRNPSVVFEYKYFTDDSNTKYFDAVTPDVNSQEDVIVVEKKKVSPTIQILIGVTVATIVIVLVTVFFFFSGIKKPTPETTAPEVIGLVYEDVIKDEQYKVKFVKVAEEKSDKYEAGVIMDQNPKAGSKIKEKQTIKVTVSTGINKAPVPDVTGKQKEEAAKIIEKAGFTVEFVREFADDVGEDLIIRTLPAANEEAVKGNKVKLYVSSGSVALPVTVPRLVGKSEGEARQTLEGIGLKSISSEVGSAEPKGQVISQSHKEGDKVNKGTTVEIQVSNGVPPVTKLSVTVPFTGELEDATFTFGIFLDGEKIDTRQINPKNTPSITVDIENSGQKTLIIQVENQTFAQYTFDFVNKTVTQVGGTNMAIIAKKAPKKVPVPNLRGLTKEAAIQKLESLKLVAVFKEVDNNAPKGEIVGQNPGVDVEVEVGSSVEVQISKGPSTSTPPTSSTPAP